ncbi:hypothetical protein AQUCO_03500013v1 [Aquilegia coerulea]|uniref:EamA domain-containing protein n=1 Tax=Aquilegia coerulea TaxID=218851 RepID=A0A2G5CVM1_AQUCA|nr:hypothetical protein AQUCO_03500013v1 [Aquilegia coerulea]PIA35322.1 hypothetical protein AQUCO_03500013v1 [Aquilegia coerulea]PIA35323.1 hypothetical protein AQUCO_03500013v1 [Aquilegia coerulea]
MLSLKPISYCFLNCHFTTTTTTTILLSSSSSSSSSFFNKFHHQIPRNGSSQLPISSTIRKRRRRRRPRFSTSPTTTTTTLVVVSSNNNNNNNNNDNSSSSNSNRISDSPESEKQKAMEIQSLPTTITPPDCFGTGLDVECLVPPQFQDTDETDRLFTSGSTNDDDNNNNNNAPSLSLSLLLDWSLLISPFFFWGTAMVAMKEVLPKAGPFFVSTFRLIPAGLLLVSFASSTGRKQPSGTMAWLSISLFALIDATCFQGFLAQGLQRTSAGLGSVIIDSQPLTVAVLATLLFGESIGVVGVAGLVLGVVGLLLLEVPVISFDGNDFSLWGSGEWWMLLAAQSMAVGTVMVRWVSKYSDPVMATGWRSVIMASVDRLLI